MNSRSAHCVGHRRISARPGALNLLRAVEGRPRVSGITLTLQPPTRPHSAQPTPSAAHAGAGNERAHGGAESQSERPRAGRGGGQREDKRREREASLPLRWVNWCYIIESGK